ncbi:EcsC family protein [Flavihumibacter sp. CACIAM 22H1]|uniref:EcsC family protein n=1 Tax=Flavihumibacter sp. CACIAM 22H1 TaxID=1812911 RepID=UPI0007A89DD1|nr:EcsC family protein [Flavihumibacter sp. CACIAM 22H1]KYP14877.1 MAG: ABC transporter-associated protein EcsC [Flavihumibacter sp. CACIAM 22H1]
MQGYEDLIRQELWIWQREMQSSPGFINRLSKSWQNKVNSWIPEKVHQAVTTTIKQMIRAVLFGAQYTSPVPLESSSFWAREAAVKERIDWYQKTASVEGAVTGAGGLLLGLADFPILLGLKLKLLFDIASMYGFDVKDYKERVYILHILELAFSSQEHRQKIYQKIEHWKEKADLLPDDIHQFEWRAFQQEYRDYLDIAKLAQLIPVIGAPVGLVVNYRLVRKLGNTAMNAYRMRLLQ